VDEVLAVGDAEFQKRCLGRMKSVASGDGRTVLFVSHNMDAVQRLCGRAVLLERGRLVAAGPTPEIVAQYLARADTPSSAGAWVDLSSVERSGSGIAKVVRARHWSDADAAGGQPYPDAPLTVALAVQVAAPCVIPSLAVTIYDLQGTKLVNADTVALGRTIRLEPGTHRLTMRISELHLNPGVYQMGFWIAGPLGVVYDYVPSGCEVEVVAIQPPGLGMSPTDDGIVTSRLEVLEAD
jgi:hypothetical protein